MFRRRFSRPPAPLARSRRSSGSPETALRPAMLAVHLCMIGPVLGALEMCIRDRIGNHCPASDPPA